MHSEAGNAAPRRRTRQQVRRWCRLHTSDPKAPRRYSSHKALNAPRRERIDFLALQTSLEVSVVACHLVRHVGRRRVSTRGLWQARGGSTTDWLLFYLDCKCFCFTKQPQRYPQSTCPPSYWAISVLLRNMPSKTPASRAWRIALYTAYTLC